MILGVWKVLAALLHHLLNSASAVSSWFEFGAEACLFVVCSPVVSCIPLCFSTEAFSEVPSLTHNSSVSTPLHVSMVISKNVGLGWKETNCSVDKRKEKTPSDSPLQVK